MIELILISIAMLECHVPEAVVEEILLLLPPTALVRLSSVCKSWHSLIHSHSFIYTHLQRSLSNPTPPPPFFLLNHSITHWSLSDTASIIATLESPYQTAQHYSYRFVESLHGLICLVEQHGLDRAIVLWNPSIGIYISVEASTPKHTAAMGFGFDSKNNDFKVIRIFHLGPVQLYSLNEGDWRVVDVSDTQELSCSLQFSHTPRFLNGNVQWIVRDVAVCPTNSILIFDVEEEKFKKMELPPHLIGVRFLNLKLTVIKGCLCVLENHTYGESDRCNIWMMREYGVAESWINMCTIRQGRTGDAFGLSTSGEILVLLQDLVKREKAPFSLHSFDPMSEEIMDFGIQGNTITACEYTGSLILLDTEINADYSPEAS